MFILGDIWSSLYKDRKSQKLLKIKKCFRVSHFAGSNVNCMIDYVKSCIRESDPGHTIFHVGTNDLLLDKDPNRIAQSIIKLAKSVMADNRHGTVSSIIPRNDQWKNKVPEVNDCLISMCRDKNIPFISHTNVINPKKNPNKSKLHLNSLRPKLPSNRNQSNDLLSKSTDWFLYDDNLGL